MVLDAGSRFNIRVLEHGEPMPEPAPQGSCASCWGCVTPAAVSPTCHPGNTVRLGTQAQRVPETTGIFLFVCRRQGEIAWEWTSARVSFLMSRPLLSRCLPSALTPRPPVPCFWQHVTQAPWGKNRLSDAHMDLMRCLQVIECLFLVSRQRLPIASLVELCVPLGGREPWLLSAQGGGKEGAGGWSPASTTSASGGCCLLTLSVRSGQPL